MFREHISARIETSVSADALRPTGPAATDASAPSFTLLLKIPFAPRLFITRRTKSVACPPASLRRLQTETGNHRTLPDRE